MIRCLLVDDEPLAHEIIEDYIEKVGYLSVVDRCYDGAGAVARIAEGGVDAVFLDVQMPDLTGIELLEALRADGPLVVLTTAYSEYAVDSFGYDQVVDYLQKPIRYARFIKTAERLRGRKNSLSGASEASATIANPPSFLLLPDERTVRRLPTASVTYVESYGNYVKAHCTDGTVTLGRRTLKDVASELARESFLRIHNRFLVNTALVSVVGRTELTVADKQLPIGKSYAPFVLSRLGVD